MHWKGRFAVTTQDTIILFAKWFTFEYEDCHEADRIDTLNVDDQMIYSEVSDEDE